MIIKRKLNCEHAWNRTPAARAIANPPTTWATSHSQYTNCKIRELFRFKWSCLQYVSEDCSQGQAAVKIQLLKILENTRLAIKYVDDSNHTAYYIKVTGGWRMRPIHFSYFLALPLPHWDDHNGATAQIKLAIFNLANNKHNHKTSKTLLHVIKKIKWHWF